MADKTPKVPDDWVSLVQERVKQAEDWAMIRQIMVNTNYYLGNQWITWNRAQKRPEIAPIDPNEERITHNVIKPRVMVKLAKQTKNRIKYDVIPDTNSQERIEIAKAAHKFIQFWWQEQEMDRKTRDIFLSNGVKGWCTAKAYFDNEVGQDITPQEGEEGYEEGMKPIHTGDIICRICDPLTIFIDPAATCDEEIRWVVERKPKDIDYLAGRYDKEITPDENLDYLGSYDITNSAENASTNNKKNKNMAMVDEMWVSPCAKYPKGLKVTVAGGQLLDIDENAGEHPYIIFGDIPIPGKVTYDAFIKDMLPIQRKINVIQTMMATHAKRMGNGMWLIPMGSQVDEEQLTNEISGFVYYNSVGGAKPERAVPPDLPSFYDRIFEFDNNFIDDMSGAREISQGRLPAGLDTASGLSLMVEQENEKLAVSSQNYERGMKKLLQRVLVLMKKHYTEERQGRILGEDNEIELIAFNGSDLSGGEDINIVQGSSLPEMRSAQEDRIMSLWNAGAIVRKDGTPDTETFLRLMGMGDSTELFEQHQLDENKAKMENKFWAQLPKSPEMFQMAMQFEASKQQYQMVTQRAQMAGVQANIPAPQVPKGVPAVRDFQDHAIHNYNHNVFRKSSEYDELPPEIQALVDAHVAEHEQYLQAPALEQQQQQAAMQQEQAKQQAEQQDKAHQQQMETKVQDHAMNMERDALKGAMAMQKNGM